MKRVGHTEAWANQSVFGDFEPDYQVQTARNDVDPDSLAAICLKQIQWTSLHSLFALEKLIPLSSRELSRHYLCEED